MNLSTVKWTQTGLYDYTLHWPSVISTTSSCEKRPSSVPSLTAPGRSTARGSSVALGCSRGDCWR